MTLFGDEKAVESARRPLLLSPVTVFVDAASIPRDAAAVAIADGRSAQAVAKKWGR